jgi:hypothetical protein
LLTAVRPEPEILYKGVVAPTVAVIMPIAPDPAEVERCRDTVASIAAWERAVRWIVLVDDADQTRDLASTVRCDGLELVALPRPACASRAGLLDRITANVLAGLAWVRQHTTADLVMKIDADALVIGPFADTIQRAVSEDSSIGLVGSYSRTCTGARRDFSPWAPNVQRAGRRVQRHGRALRLATGRRARVRQIVVHARSVGYEWGEHALACAFAIPRHVYASWGDQGLLDDPCLFLGSNLGDDPVLGLLVRHSGKRLANLVDEGEPFGVAWRGLPFPPPELLERGHSIVHCVKNDAEWPEERIREFFGAQRLPAR